jgi:hypothetical protein
MRFLLSSATVSRSTVGAAVVAAHRHACPGWPAALPIFGPLRQPDRLTARDVEVLALRCEVAVMGLGAALTASSCEYTMDGYLAAPTKARHHDQRHR